MHPFHNSIDIGTQCNKINDEFNNGNADDGKKKDGPKKKGPKQKNK